MFRKMCIIWVSVVMVGMSAVSYAMSNKLPLFSDFAADVDPHTGSATFSVPISVPAGRAGIQPNIQLQYNSKLGNGFLGVGWTLQLGAIQRLTIGGLPSYTDSDTFCLMQAGSTQRFVYDTDAGFYRTEPEGAFSKIEHLSNPEQWMMTDRTGTRYYFGSTDASRQVDPNNSGNIFQWAIDRVEDMHGNDMVFTYQKSNNRLRPLRVEYTGNSLINNDLPYAAVEFDWEARTDTSSSHIAGFSSEIQQRIHRIRTLAQGRIVREYEISYDYSELSERSLITQMTEYGDDGVSSKPALSFDYQDDVIPAYTVTANNNFMATGDRLWNVRWEGFERGHENFGPCPPPHPGWESDPFSSQCRTVGYVYHEPLASTGRACGQYWIAGNGNLTF